MPITEKQIEQRRESIGSSDIAAIMDLSPWTTTLDLYYEKIGETEPWEGNKATDIGTRLEPVVLEWAEEQLGKLKRNQRRVYKPSNLAANIDAVTVEDNVPVEAKTSRDGLGYGEPGTDEVPFHVAVQCHVHMICLGVQDKCFVPVFIIGGFNPGFYMYKVEFNRHIADEIIMFAKGFWRCVEERLPPLGNITLELAKRLKRLPETVSEIKPETLECFQEMKKLESAASTFRKCLQAELLTQIGQTEAGTIEGEVAVTYFANKNGTRVFREVKKQEGNNDNSSHESRK